MTSSGFISTLFPWEVMTRSSLTKGTLTPPVSVDIGGQVNETSNIVISYTRQDHCTCRAAIALVSLYDIKILSIEDARVLLGVGIRKYQDYKDMNNNLLVGFCGSNKGQLHFVMYTP